MLKILISNDDGYYAEGIKALSSKLGEKFEITLVAPDRERSSCGHGISLDQPIRMNRIEDRSYTCSGLPADCILVGLGALFSDKKPDFIVSGINHGANLGQDRFYSGTMAAAREGVFRGIPSIATSLVTKRADEVRYFDTATHYISRFLESELALTIPENCLININVPNLPLAKISGVSLSSPGFQDYTEEILIRKDAKGMPYYWIGGNHSGHTSITGSDCNSIAVGEVSFDLQDMSGRNEIEQATRDEFSKRLQQISWK